MSELKIKTGRIELLAPAKDLECGVAAIDHGADAVYIGGPSFSARAAAGNSLDDIGTLIQAAHRFHVRVYIAINTILTDSEIDEALKIIHQLHLMGADAVIIQDMGLLECDLPPIALHASTQMNIRSIEKVRFLEELGFQQVVLARELSLEQIRDIKSNSSVTLECFVHGALCVSYSGQCYISEVMTGRSANRGECAQFCRHKFSLMDAEGREIIKNKHLLSLKDLNQVNNLAAMLEAGVRSFKIEGRLKDSSYVKNITALYRQRLDQIIAGNPKFVKGSSGHVALSFEPDPAKTFHRGQTDYLLLGKNNRAAEINTPKSIGEEIGRVVLLGKDYIDIKSDTTLSNGDGLCYFDRDHQLVGFRLNKVTGRRLFPAKIIRPPVGTIIYRNFDKRFHQLLENSNRCRKIAVSMRVTEVDDGLLIVIKDEDSIESRFELQMLKQKAKRPEQTRQAILKQIRRSGETIFQVEAVEIDVEPTSYYPLSEIKKLRRGGLEQHLQKRNSLYHADEVALQKKKNMRWHGQSISYLDNVANSRAARFYKRCGAEFSRDMLPKDLMRCRYCIKAQLNLCPELDKPKRKYSEPLTIKDNTGEYTLTFDCRRCEMIVRKRNASAG